MYSYASRVGWSARKASNLSLFYLYNVKIRFLFDEYHILFKVLTPKIPQTCLLAIARERVSTISNFVDWKKRKKRII